MIDTERLYTYTAMMKWYDQEPMSIQDLERIVKVFETKLLQTSQVDPASLSGTQMRLRDALSKYYQQAK